MLIGCVIARVGAILVFVLVVPLGRLPGDIRIESEHTRNYFPIATCLVLSVILSFLMWLVRSFLH